MNIANTWAVTEKISPQLTREQIAINMAEARMDGREVAREYLWRCFEDAKFKSIYFDASAIILVIEDIYEIANRGHSNKIPLQRENKTTRGNS